MIFIKLEKIESCLSKRVHSMLLTRGVPGTHDINLMLNFFKKIKNKKFKSLKVPTLIKQLMTDLIKKIGMI